MKKSLALTVLSSAMVVSMALATTHAVAANAVSINGNACGSYTGVTFDQNGNLKLSGILTCIGDVDGDSDNTPEDPITPPKDPVDPPEVVLPEDGDEPANCSANDKKLVSAKYSLFEHSWLKPIGANVRTPVILKPSEVFTIKIDKPQGAVGYGHLNTINSTQLAGARTVVVSQCPGSMEPIQPIGWDGQGDNPCQTVGMEDKLSVTFYESVPKGSSQCRLDPNGQYYFNIKHQYSNGKNSCVGSQCYFAYEYNMDVSKRHTK